MSRTYNPHHRRKSLIQPVCMWCWYACGAPKPTPVTRRRRERCCDCGRFTRDGIWLERDPTTVAFPSYEDQEN